MLTKQPAFGLSRRLPGVAPPFGIAGPILGFTATVAFIVCFLIGERGPTFAYAIVTVAAAGAIAFMRFRRNGLCDALGLFCFAFIAYNGFMLLRFMTMADLTDIPYPWPFSQETYAQAGLLGAIASVTIFVTASVLMRIWPAPHSAPNAPNTRIQSSNYSRWFLAGLAMFIAGIALYFLFYDQIGGYWAGVKAGRVERYEFYSAQHSDISWPFAAFIVPGLAAIWYASSNESTPTRKWLAWSTLGLWCGLELLQGDRLVVIQAVLTVLAVSITSRGTKIPLNVKTISALAAAYVLLAFFGQFRAVIAPLTGGAMSDSEAEVYVESHSMLDSLKPERSELAGPYFSLLQTVGNPSDSLSADNSYITSLPAFLPKALYPGTKPVELANHFAEVTHSGHNAVAGWGFSPVCEAYLNFGTAGIVFVFMLWTAFFWGLDRLRYLAPFGLLLSCTILFESIDANRIDFRNVHCTFVYFAAGVLLTNLLAKLIASIGSASELHLAPARSRA